MFLNSLQFFLEHHCLLFAKIS